MITSYVTVTWQFIFQLDMHHTDIRVVVLFILISVDFLLFAYAHDITRNDTSTSTLSPLAENTRYTLLNRLRRTELSNSRRRRITNRTVSRLQGKGVKGGKGKITETNRGCKNEGDSCLEAWECCLEVVSNPNKRLLKRFTLVSNRKKLPFDLSNFSNYYI